MHFSEFGEWIRTGFTYHMCIYHNIYIYSSNNTYVLCTFPWHTPYMFHTYHPFQLRKPMAGASQLLRRGPTLVATAVVSRRLAVRRQGLRRCAAVAVLGTEQVLCPALSGEGWVGNGWDGPGWLVQYLLVN